MKLHKLVSIIVLYCAAGAAQAACAPIRVGYLNQDRPPYYLGNGSEPANPPGASIEMIREIAASIGCPIVFVRLPVARVRMALEAGSIDIAPMSPIGDESATFAFPLGKNGKLDADSGLPLVSVVFVRSSDAIARDVDTMRHLQGRTIGINHGAMYAEGLRQAGVRVDDGASDVARNIEKLRRGRIDGYAVTLVSAQDMDGFIAAHFAGELTRLEKPLQSSHVWLAVNKAYYARNREQVDAIWAWVARNGRTRFAQLLDIYSHGQ
ncbi:MAG: transporter substrate-binding domain-containing protein [Pseudomonadota bacterium]